MNAATTLRAIGGECELTAMDVWLNGAAHANDLELRQHVRAEGEALRKRLDQTRNKK